MEPKEESAEECGGPVAVSQSQKYGEQEQCDSRVSKDIQGVIWGGVVAPDGPDKGVHTV